MGCGFHAPPPVMFHGSGCVVVNDLLIDVAVGLRRRNGKQGREEFNRAQGRGRSGIQDGSTPEVVAPRAVMTCGVRIQAYGVS